MTQTQAAIAKVYTLGSMVDRYNELIGMIVENEGVMTPEMEALLADAQDQIGDKLDGYAAFISYCKGQQDFLKREIEAFQSRNRTIGATIDHLRERMIWAMQVIGEEKVKTAKHSYSLREVDSITVDEELLSNAVLDEFIEKGLAERSYKLDKKAINAEYKNWLEDDLPDYIKVERRPSLTIR